jgi:hypothetical protein
MANTPIPSSIPIASTTHTISILSPDQMVAIDTRVEELKYAFDHDQCDIIHALKKYDIIRSDRSELADYCKEESIALKNILLTKWDNTMFIEKIIFHSSNRSLPYWSYLYPASKQFIENTKDWINKRP